MCAIITLTTDFGAGSPYVAAMKGVILSINPAATLVDISHAIGPQNIRQGAVLLAEATTWFPAGTIHVAWSIRAWAPSGESSMPGSAISSIIAPDNGLLSRLGAQDAAVADHRRSRPEYWLPSVSDTFHGRDIMAPVAAQLSLGWSRIGSAPPLAELVELDWPAPRVEANEITGEVVWIDAFGNLITNITAAMLARLPSPAAATIEIAGHIDPRHLPHLRRSARDTLIALVGSSGYLELAIVGGSAATTAALRTPVAPSSRSTGEERRRRKRLAGRIGHRDPHARSLS